MHFLPIEHPADDAHVAHGGGGRDTLRDTPALEADAAAAAAAAAFDAFDALDDVFGTGEEVLPNSVEGPSSAAHPSDMRRLETEHTTAGYREGVAAAKAKTLQAGFDEGFALGATLGSAAGQLLGMLEGIREALKHRHDPVAEQAKTLNADARGELSVREIFSSDFWAADGNWRYEVEPDGDEVVFSDVARAHPLIRKWTSIVGDEIRRWRIDRSVVDGEAGGPRTAAADEPAMPFAASPSRKPLDW